MRAAGAGPGRRGDDEQVPKVAVQTQGERTRPSLPRQTPFPGRDRPLRGAADILPSTPRLAHTVALPLTRVPPPRPVPNLPCCSYPRAGVHSLPTPARCQMGPSPFSFRSCVVPCSHLVVARADPLLLLLGPGKTFPSPLLTPGMTLPFLFCLPPPLSWTRNVPLNLPPQSGTDPLPTYPRFWRGDPHVPLPGPGRTPPSLCAERVPIPLSRPCLPDPGPIRASAQFASPSLSRAHFFPCPPACCQMQGSPLPGGGGVSAPGAAGSAGSEVRSSRRCAPPRPWGRGLGSAPCSSAAAPVALRALRPCRLPRARVRCGQS